ncbi:MAG: cytochrome ubiquinol oxidase subunit I, partial [Nocardioidaceae bacterium]
MTILTDRAPASSLERPAEPVSIGRLIVSWLTTTDHKVIGKLYLMTSFGFFLIAGLMAMVMRAELAQPGMQVLGEQKGEELYNQLFTM